MANLSAADLLKQAAESPHRIYYLYGKDVAAVSSLCTRLVKKLGEDLQSVQRFVGKTLDLNAFSDAVAQFPMLCEHNVLLLHDPNGEEWSADFMATFLSILEDTSASTVVICYVTGFDVCGGKKAPTSKNKKLVDYAQKHGAVCCLDPKTAVQLAKPIADSMAKRGCAISRQNAELLATLCLCNSLMIQNEIEKLCAYQQSGEITKETIHLLVAKQLDINAFALARAVVARNGRAAMQALDELTAERAEPVMLLSAISGAFVDLYRVKAAQSHGKHQEHLMQDFNYRGREFAVRNALRDATRISIEQLRECICILCGTDLALKSSKTDGRTLIEEAITRMLIAGSQR